MSIYVLASPSRYVQGKNALDRLGDHLAALAGAPLVVADDVVWSLVEEQVTASLTSADLRTVRVGFGQYATPAAVDTLVEQIRSGDHDIIVAVGGGSVIDAVKAAGHLAEVKWASVPSAASSDAPTSALSVIYTEDGGFLEYRLFPKNPDLVLIDTQVVANAPERFLIGGIGDALATWVEARAAAKGTGTTMAGGRPLQTGTALARLSWELLWENALPALEAVRAKAVTPALEKVVEANTLLSGLGFESGGLAAAHAIHNGLTAAPSTHELTHGEKVNIGTITQLVLEGAATTEVEEFIAFTTRVGLPNSLTEIGLSVDDEAQLRAVADAATADGETIHNMPFPVTPEMVVDAMKAVEGLSRSVRAARGLREPTRVE